MRRPELLSPAGDRERLEAAVRFGADAVYLASTQYGMRAAPQNFSPEALAEAVSFAHENGVRVYLTVNTLPRCDETPALPDFLREAAAAGVDALIVADLGVLALARELLPEMELHASTQTGVCNDLTANALGRLGVRRVVLARELTLAEIRTIRERTDPAVELEAFVHGAMCMSVSGRCTISNFLADRDANRGACAQPCRWNYRLVEEKRPGVYLPVFEDGESTTILSAEDLCMIEHLRDLWDAGVAAFKIEGRAKTAYYAAVVTGAYRAAVDAMAAGEDCPAWALRELETVSHRAYSTGFYYGKSAARQTYIPDNYLQAWELSATVERAENGRLYVTERNRFCEGDTLELLEPKRPPKTLAVRDLRDEAGKPIACANRPLMKASMAFAGEAAGGAFLRRAKAPKT